MFNLLAKNAKFYTSRKFPAIRYLLYNRLCSQRGGVGLKYAMGVVYIIVSLASR